MSCKIPYIENDVAETIRMVIDVERNMDLFIQAGLTEDKGVYPLNCLDMCNISTMMIGQTLSSLCEAGSLIVHEGVFGMIGNHTWLEIEEVIVDGTLCQFIEDAKPLSIIDNSYSEYQSVKSYKFEDWEKKNYPKKDLQEKLNKIQKKKTTKL